jgi:hypothetical protein
MSSKATRRERFSGRRQRQPVAMDERALEEDKLSDPHSCRDDWIRWMELQRELETAEDSN